MGGKQSQNKDLRKNLYPEYEQTSKKIAKGFNGHFTRKTDEWPKTRNCAHHGHSREIHIKTIMIP